MKIFKNILYWLPVSLLGLGSCVDDSGIKPIDNEDQSGETTISVHLNLTMPDIMSTRGVEDDEKALSFSGNYCSYIFFFDSSNNYLTHQKITSAPVDNVVKVSVNSAALNGTPKIIMLANVDDNATDGLFKNGTELPSTYRALLAKTTKVETGVSNPFIMSGEVTATASGSNTDYKVELERSVAKVSIDNEADDFVLESYTMYKGALNGYAAAALESDPIYSGATKSSFTNLKDGDMLYNYSYPVASAGRDTENLNKAYFIIRGKYKDQTCYYRVDLRYKEGNEYKYYDLKPNHWYQVTVKSVNSLGYSSAEEASKRYMGQESEIVVAIHDHSANVMAMVSDGAHELGASRQIYYNENQLDENNENYKDNKAHFTIRLYCASNGSSHNGHMPTYDDATKKLTASTGNFRVRSLDDWITIGEVVPVTGQFSGSENNHTESPGQRYMYTVTMDPTKTVDGEGTIRITWLGMTLDVPVYHKQQFDATKILSETKITIHNTDENSTSTQDYWEFLGNVSGVDEEAMGAEKNRNDGFHFPIMYGKNSNSPWWYEYSMKLNNIDGAKGYNFKIESSKHSSVWNSLVVKQGENNISMTINNDFKDSNKKSITGNLSDLEFSISRPSKGNDYDYSTAVLTMRIYTGDEEDQYVDKKFNLYHTGFFHESGSNWYYYEVVKLANDTYWLDRNIGATSNGLYIQNDMNQSIFTDEDGYPYSTGAAAGDYLTVAEGVSYKEPKFSETVCPPGYRLPKKSEFEDLRNSANFITEQRKKDASAVHYTAYYDSEEAGRIYFPKSRFKNGGGWAGDPRAGYYWTQTIASGYEKVQIGHWVKAFYISGNSSSYMDADVDNFQMSLRCVAGQATSKSLDDTSYTIGFNVKGATHVYLYSVGSDGSRTGIFSFPGKGICSDNTTQQLFTYNSPVPEEQLYVYFTYRDDNGKIWVLSPKNPENYNQSDPINGDLTSETNFLSAADIEDISSIQGWPVKNDNLYQFDWSNANVYFPENLWLVIYIHSNFYANGYRYLRYWKNGEEPASWESLFHNQGMNAYYQIRDDIKIKSASISTIYFQLAKSQTGNNATEIYSIYPSDCLPDERDDQINYFFDSL